MSVHAVHITQKTNTLALLCVAGGAVAMGLSPIFMRWSELGPFATAFWRVALALPALYAWMRIETKANMRIKLFAPALWQAPTLLAGLAFAGDLFFWHLGVARTSIANATFYATCAPIWVIIFSWLLYRTPILAKTVQGIVLCLLGGLLLTGATASFFVNFVRAFGWQDRLPLLDIAKTSWQGDLEGLAAGVFFGLYFLAVKAARASLSAAEITFAGSCVTAALLAVIALLSGQTLLPQSWLGCLDLLAIALISHAAGQGLLAFALGQLPAVFSSLVIFLEALAAAFFGWVFIGESVSLLQILGGSAIIGGIFLARPKR